MTSRCCRGGARAARTVNPHKAGAGRGRSGGQCGSGSGTAGSPRAEADEPAGGGRWHGDGRDKEEGGGGGGGQREGRPDISVTKAGRSCRGGMICFFGVIQHNHLNDTCHDGPLFLY